VSSRGSLIVHYGCFSISVAKARCAGGVWIGCNRRFGASVHGIAIGINHLTKGGATRIRPNDVGTGWTSHDVDVIAEKLLLQVVVAGTIRIRRGCANLKWCSEGRPTSRRVGEVVIVDLHACLPEIVCRRLGQGIKGEADGAARGNTGLWEEGIAIRDIGNLTKLGPVSTIERDRALDDALSTAKVAPDDVDPRAAGVSSRVWIAIYALSCRVHDCRDLPHQMACLSVGSRSPGRW